MLKINEYIGSILHKQKSKYTLLIYLKKYVLFLGNSYNLVDYSYYDICFITSIFGQFGKNGWASFPFIQN